MTDGTFDDLLNLAEENLRPIISGLKQLVVKVDPNTCEVVRIGERAATYGVGPKKMSEGYCYIQPHKSWINLGFYQGAFLQDPKQMLEGTGKKLRHVKIRALDDINKPALRALIKEALSERKTALKA